MRQLYPLLTIALLLLGNSAQAQNPLVALTPFITGLSQPIDITHAGDGSDRLFVHEKTGAIKVFSATGTSLGTFLDLSALASTSGERGLLGLAFAPDYATSGRFYVNYTNIAGNTVIARYTVNAGNPNVANPASAEILLTYTQPFANHNGGDLGFGNDGLLYIASGDGGSGNDPQANSQNLNSLLGKILRINVSGATGYLPAGNYPGALSEIYAVGMRNPWRMSFDRQTGDLWIGDVGQGAREEIDVIVPGQTNLNFGWVCWEGSRDNRSVASAANSSCQAYSAYEPPVFEYDHSAGQSVTGGLVYRGSEFPTLQGFYLLSDYQSDQMWAVRGTGATQEVYIYPATGTKLVGFGESESGDLYAVSVFGSISKVVSNAPLPSTITEFVAETRNCAAEVRWAAATEVNLDYYELELAGRDLRWSAFAKTYANAIREYRTQLPESSQATYARLKTVDLDGSVEYGPVIVLSRPCAAAFSAYPNPLRTGALLDIRIPNAVATEVKIFDVLGRLVYGQQAFAQNPIHTVSTVGWPSGAYTISVGVDRQQLIVAD